MNTINKIKDVICKLLFIMTKQQKKYGILVLMASFIGAILETLGVSVILPLMNALLTPNVFKDNVFFSKILIFLGINDNRMIVFVVISVTIILYIVKNIYFIFLSWVRAKYACKVKRELSVKMLRNYLDKGYPYFLTKNTSELMRGVFADVNSTYVVLNQLLKLVIDFLTITLICFYIMITDIYIALSMVILALICLLIVTFFFKGTLQNSGKISRKYEAIINQHVIQAFQGIKEVIVSRKQDYFINNFESAYMKKQKADVSQSVGAESPAYVIEALCIAGLLGIVGFRVVFSGENAQAMLPVLSAFAMGAFRILPALGRISAGFNTMVFYVHGLNEMTNRIKESENDNTYALKEIYNTKDISQKVSFNDCIEIKNIYWKYSENSGYVLNDLCLKINKGESIALIGQSGAGKTTLADVILGLLKPQKGSIFIDGIDIFSIGKEWSQIMGYVPQSVYLTDDTLRKNIAFGVSDEDIDDNRVWKALEQAKLREFVENLKDKLDTKVGERGIRFSGGQRQRIAIARALYENPSILVLDEATAALDNETEKAVMESIEALQGRITLIIIAHRLSTVRKCDRIYEIKGGVAVERDKEEIFS